MKIIASLTITNLIRVLTIYDFLDKCKGRRVPNLEVIRKHLLREGHLNKPELMEIIAGAAAVMSKSSAVNWQHYPQKINRSKY